jgi:hypothetical protein
MAHDLYPGFIKLTYTVNAIQHTMIQPVLPAAGWVVGVEPMISVKTGADQLMSTAVNAFVTLLRPLLFTASSIDAAEAWFITAPGGDPIWVYTHPIGLAGTGAGSAGLMQQLVISFRSSVGGTYRLYVMEHIASILPNVRTAYPWGAGVVKTLADWLTSAASYVIARDGGELIVPVWYNTKFNDALRKKRLLF